MTTTTGTIYHISGGQKVLLAEMDALVVEALSTIVYKRAKMSNLLLRIQVFTGNTFRIIHLVPDAFLMFEHQEHFDTADVYDLAELLSKSIDDYGLLSFDRDGKVLPPYRKAMRKPGSIAGSFNRSSN